MKNKIKRITFAILALAFVLAGCGDVSSEGTQQTVTVRKLVIESPPDKTTYEVGDMFEPAGVVINAYLTDGTIEENVAYEIDINEPLTKDIRAVTFSYRGKKVEQSISVLSKGNNEMYAVANTPELQDSPLAEKTYYFLGSSVTAGSGSGGESIADYIAKRNNAVCIKEAVAGTTLADVENNMGQSYIKRFDAYLESDECVDYLDAFICQLSTNDRNTPEIFGVVTEVDIRDAGIFDKTTTYGAIEYIIAKVQEKWNCPIIFYTNTPMDDENYKVMVDTLYEIKEKWDITIIDLYYDEEFNNITADELALYMSDAIHPTKAGYREWWVPKFEEILSSLN